MSRRGIFRAILWLVLVLAILLGIFVGLAVYAERFADRHAREFCGTIPIGSNISSATARATEQKIFWAPGSEYDFYFFYLFPFDKSVCEVSVSSEGKVISKIVKVEID